MPSRPVLGITAFSLIALSVAGCGAEAASTGGTSANQGSEQRTLTITTTEYLNVIPTEIGITEGLFEERGIDLKREYVRVSTDAMANLVAGRAEIANVQATAIQDAAAQGVDLVILAPSWILNAKNPLFVPADSDIESVEDLQGKTVGLANLAGVPTAAFILILEESGISPEDVEMVAAPADQSAQALESGSVDAAQILEPYASQSADVTRELIPDLYAPFGSELPAGFWVTTKEIAENKRELIADFVDAIEEANELAAADEEASREVAAELLGIDDEVAAQMAMPSFGNDEQLEAWQKALEAMTNMGFIEGPVIDLQARTFEA